MAYKSLFLPTNLISSCILFVLTLKVFLCLCIRWIFGKQDVMVALEMYGLEIISKKKKNQLGRHG